MEFWSWTIAVILGLSAIASPIITTLINNNYLSKIKKIEIYELAKRSSLQTFIKCASKCFDSPTLGYLCEYYDSLNNLYIYFSDIPKEINNLINLRGNDFNQSLTNIVVKLSKQIAKG